MSLDATLPFTSITLMQLLTAVVALIVGIIVARIVLGFFRRSMRKTKLSDILVEFLTLIDS